jgi:PadR family transcriptional regulator, regulatory protein PadR
MKGEALKGHLDLLLLAALQHRPAHGYAIVETLRTRSSGAFDLPEGTIYPALHRLEDDGWIMSRWSDAAGRRRRVYELTGRGQARLAQRQTEWRAFLEAMNSVVEAMA